jgi:hypothetical protein
MNARWFEEALRAHTQSVKALIEYIDGDRPTPPPHGDACALAAWFDGAAVPFAGFEEYARARGLHARFHAEMDRIVALVDTGDRAAARARMNAGSSFSRLSRAFIVAIDNLVERIERAPPA